MNRSEQSPHGLFYAGTLRKKAGYQLSLPRRRSSGRRVEGEAGLESGRFTSDMDPAGAEACCASGAAMLGYPKEIPMATLYVENIPDDLYEALRGRAREHRKSIAAEVICLLEENVPTAREMELRQKFLRRIRRLRSQRSPSVSPFPSAEEMQREDRVR
ncbi:MAG: FitA-like ribbon-helix-helix domain-containing protein [Terriglobia bacterium]